MTHQLICLTTRVSTLLVFGQFLPVGNRQILRKLFPQQLANGSPHRGPSFALGHARHEIDGRGCRKSESFGSDLFWRKLV